MSVENGKRLVTKQDLADFYNDIRPYMGGLPEVLANKFSKGDLYDTSEKMIGKWIDNKPVYQRTIQNTTLTTISNSSWDNYSEIANVDSIVTWHFGRMNSNGKVVDVMGDISCWYDGNTGYLKVRSRTDNLSCANGSIVTICYTKTTDSANSFNIGEATDYSTEEKIIGTWLSGEPLYQITFTTTNVTLSSNLTALGDLSGLSIDKCFITNVFGMDSNYSYGEAYIKSWVRLPNDNIGVITVSGQELALNYLSVTIQYTKSNS